MSEETRRDEELDPTLTDAVDPEDVDLEDDPDDEDEDEPTGPTVEKDIDAVFGRNQAEEQRGRWFFCSQMGNPGDLIRDLGSKAEMRVARVPNDGYDDAMDALTTKYERRGGKKVPNKVLRKRLPEIYAEHVFVGMRNIRMGGKYLPDTYANRLMLLRKFQPDLMNAVYRHAERLENFQDHVDDELEPDFEGPEAREAALGNS